MEPMKTQSDLKAIRQTQLKAWVDKHGSPTQEKSLFSQLINGKISFGEKVSRRIENDYSMPAMYLDGLTEIEPDTVILHHRDISVSCGSGVINAEYPELIRSIEIPKDQIFKIFGRNDLKNIDIVSIDGDSMEPTISKQSIAFVDHAITEYKGDGVYVFFYIDGVYMKRLQRLPGKLLAISDNPIYKPFEVNPNEEDFRIIAKFIGVLPMQVIKL